LQNVVVHFPAVTMCLRAVPMERHPIRASETQHYSLIYFTCHTDVKEVNRKSTDLSAALKTLKLKHYAHELPSSTVYFHWLNTMNYAH
jgi:hypothetical protein